MPKIQKINKNTTKSDKNIFTGDKNSSNIMKIQTLPGDNIISNKKKKKSKSKEKSVEKNKSINNSDSAKDILKQLDDDINNLKSLLQQKNEEFEKLKSDKINEINDINNKIFEKNLKIDSLTKNTTILLNELTIISKDIDAQYAKYNIDLEIEKQKIKIEKKEYENNLKNNIIRGKNSKQHYKNIIDMLKIQKEKLEKIIKEETNERINEYNYLLENLIQKEDKIKNKIFILNNIKNKHIKLCEKKKEKLSNILNRVKSEYEYENKRNEKNNYINSLIDYNNPNEDNNKKNLIKPIRIIDNKNINTLNIQKNNSYLNNKNKSLPKINRNKINILFQDKENKNSLENKNKSLNNNRKSSDIIKTTFSDKNILKKPIIYETPIINNFSIKNSMEKDLFLIKKHILIMKKLKNNPSINNSANSNNSLLSYINLNNNNNISDSSSSTNAHFLFSKTEKNFLSKIVPNECLDKYQEKFNNLEEQRQIWKEKIKDNITQKKINSHQYNEIELAQLKKKAIDREMIKLHSKLSEIKKNINNIKNENKNISKKYIDLKNKFKKRKNENEKMMNYFQNFYSEIKNNKIKLKKWQKLNKDEINAINKWAGPNDLYVIHNNEYESENDNEDNYDDHLDKKENNDGKEENENEKEKNEDCEENEINNS